MPITGLGIRDDDLYKATYLAIPAWGLLMFAPNHRNREQIVRYTIFGACVLYTLLMADIIRAKGYNFFGDMQQGTNLAGIRNMLANRDTALPAWLHFIAFDLWVANKVVNDNQAAGGLPPWLMVATLCLMAAFGPAGFIFYVCATQAWPRIRQDVRSGKHQAGRSLDRGANQAQSLNPLKRHE